LHVFSRQVIRWFKENGRDLPWRQTSDPYHIWLSEVILQQTRVAQGTHYYHRFCTKFPNVKILAESTEDEVLEIWQGLGYYSRARNLHSAAQWILKERDGVFPNTYKDLLKMKGVGSYTAAAIASFAFHEDQVVVDGNVIRVFARIFGITQDVRLATTVEMIRQRVQEWLPSGQSWFYNQSIMELGALVCVPLKPKCSNCPVLIHCFAYNQGLQSSIPFKSKSKERRKRFLNYVLLEVDGLFFFTKRFGKDIWEGLYEPILIETEFSFSKSEEFISALPVSPASITRSQVYPLMKHILSHQELYVSVCHIFLEQKPDIDFGRWVDQTEFMSLAKPVIFSKILYAQKGSLLSLSF